MLQNMRDMMDVKKLDEATWGRLRSQFKDFVHSYEDISQSHKELQKDQMRAAVSGAAAPSLGGSSPRPGLAAASGFANPMSGRRTGKKKEFGRAASGRGLGGKRSSRGLLLKPTNGDK